MPKYDSLYAKTLILDRIQRSENFMRPFRDDFEEIYKQYVCYTINYPEILSGQRSNVFIPYVFSKIETKLPRIIQAMVGSEDWFQVIGVGDEDDQNAVFHDKLLKYQFSNEIDTLWFFITWYKECMLYGNSFAGVFYDKETKDIRKRKPKYYDKEGNNLYPHILGYDFVPQKKTVYDGVSLVPLDIFDCYPSPVGARVNGLMRDAMDYFILRSEPSASYLKSMIEDKEIADMHGWDVEAVKKVLSSKPSGAGLMDRNRTERMNYRGMQTALGDDIHNPHYEMYTMWEDDSVVSIIDNDIVRNCGPDKFPFYEMRKPIVMALDTPVPHELFALGQVRPILRLNYYAQDLENAKMDSILDEVYPGYLVDENSFPKDYINILRRNMRGIHPVAGNALTAITPIQKTGKSSIATGEQVNLERLINMTLGSADIISGGQSPRGDQTATEISQQIQQANARFNLSVRLLKDFSHKELLLMMIDRNTQYAPDEKLIRVFNENGDIIRGSIKPENLVGNFDVKVRTSPMMGNKMIYLQNLLKAKAILDSDNGSRPELTKQILDTLEVEGVEIEDRASRAVQVIAQASQEGLLENGQQAAAVLGEVLKVLAPPPQNTGTGGAMPPQDETGLARQEAQIGRME